MTTRTLVLDALDHPDAELLAALAFAADAQVTWTRDATLADSELSVAGPLRCLVACASPAVARLAGFLARAARGGQVEVLLSHPTSDAVRALLTLGVHRVWVDPSDRRRFLHGLAGARSGPTFLPPVEAARAEVRVWGAVVRLGATRPEVEVDVPVTSAAGDEVVVVGPLAEAFGLPRITFRSAEPVDGGPDRRRLADPAEPAVAAAWADVVGALPTDAGGEHVPWPGSALAAVWVAAPARWCSASGNAFEVSAHLHARPGAVVEVAGGPRHLRASTGVFGRVVRAEGTQTTRLRCDCLPTSDHPLLTVTHTPMTAPSREGAPPRRRRKVEPTLVVSVGVGLLLALGLVWMSLHRPAPPVNDAPPASTAEVMRAVRQAF